MYRPRKKAVRKVNTVSWSKVLTYEEQAVLMNYLYCRAKATDKKDASWIVCKRELLICEILLRTGLRKKELINLRVQHTPVVLGTKAIEVYNGKGQKDRTVPISERLAEAIREYVDFVRPRTLPRHVTKTVTSSPLFFSQRKKPFTEIGMHVLVVRIAKAAGIKKHLTAHKLRHTFATFALMPPDKHGAGMDLKRLQIYLGHSSLDVTEKYLHFVGGMSHEDGEVLDRPIIAENQAENAAVFNS